MVSAGLGISRGSDEDPGALVPILLDLQLPFPFQMFVLVVVREETLDVVGAACHHPSRRLFLFRRAELKLRLWGITTDHQGRLVNCRRNKKVDKNNNNIK